MNLCFPGQYFDTEHNLHYNHFRYYDPSIGRYITSDPIGLDGGMNSYGYAIQNRLQYTDPNGQFSWLVAIVFAESVCAIVAWNKATDLFTDYEDKKRHCYVSCVVNRCTGLLFPYVAKWVGDLHANASESFNFGRADPADVDANIYGIAYSLLPSSCKGICEC